LRKFYRENSRGPAKNEVGERIGLNKLYEGTDHFIFLRTAQFDKDISEMKQRELIAQGLCENAKEMLKDERDKNSEAIRKMREKA
jgi:hypothetical protein